MLDAMTVIALIEYMCPVKYGIFYLVLGLHETQGSNNMAFLSSHKEEGA